MGKVRLLRVDQLEFRSHRDSWAKKAAAFPKNPAFILSSRTSFSSSRRRARSVIDVLSGLGCRIGELLALDWTKADADAGALSIEGMIRIPGEGLIVKPHTKSKAGMRTITPPAWVLDMLKRRHAGSLCAWIFPRTRLTLRDPDNTRARLHDVVRATPWEGCTRMRFGTWWRLSWTEQACRRARSPTIWGTSASR